MMTDEQVLRWFGAPVGKPFPISNIRPMHTAPKDGTVILIHRTVKHNTKYPVCRAKWFQSNNGMRLLPGRWVNLDAVGGMTQHDLLGWEPYTK